LRSAEGADVGHDASPMIAAGLIVSTDGVDTLVVVKTTSPAVTILHCVHEKNCNPVYVAITLANNVGF